MRLRIRFVFLSRIEACEWILLLYNFFFPSQDTRIRRLNIKNSPKKRFPLQSYSRSEQNMYIRWEFPYPLETFFEALFGRFFNVYIISLRFTHFIYKQRGEIQMRLYIPPKIRNRTKDFVKAWKQSPFRKFR